MIQTWLYLNTLANDDVTVDIINFANIEPNLDDEVTYDAESGLLVGGLNTNRRGFTVYTFDNDLGTTGSTCTGDCLQAWTPVLVADDNVSGIPGLGSFERSDGGIQASFQGRPLYFFINDVARADTNGDGLDNVWSVVSLPQTVISVQGSIVSTTDVMTSNGTIHVIDTVITETLE